MVNQSSNQNDFIQQKDKVDGVVQLTFKDYDAFTRFYTRLRAINNADLHIIFSEDYSEYNVSLIIEAILNDMLFNVSNIFKQTFDSYIRQIQSLTFRLNARNLQDYLPKFNIHNISINNTMYMRFLQKTMIKTIDVENYFKKVFYEVFSGICDIEYKFNNYFETKDELIQRLLTIVNAPYNSIPIGLHVDHHYKMNKVERETNMNISKKPNLKDYISKVIYNDPATIVLWKDGTKTVAKCGKNDKYNPEQGLAICMLEYMLGDKSYNDVFKTFRMEDVSKVESKQQNASTTNTTTKKSK